MQAHQAPVEVATESLVDNQRDYTQDTSKCMGDSKAGLFRGRLHLGKVEQLETGILEYLGYMCMIPFMAHRLCRGHWSNA